MKIKKILWVTVILIIAGWGLYYFWFQWYLGQLIAEKIVYTMMHESYEVQKVDANAWKQLKVDFSKEQVVSLLGNTTCQKVATYNRGSQNEETIDVWEYNYCSQFITWDADPRQYVVFFDKDGKVSSFKAPSLKEDTLVNKE